MDFICINCWSFTILCSYIQTFGEATKPQLSYMFWCKERFLIANILFFYFYILFHTKETLIIIFLARKRQFMFTFVNVLLLINYKNCSLRVNKFIFFISFAPYYDNIIYELFN